jgi:hypothetical protein
MNGLLAQQINDLFDQGLLTEEQRTEAIEKIPSTTEQDSMISLLDQLHNAAHIFDDEYETIKSRILNAHLK